MNGLFHPTTSCPKRELRHTELTDASAPKAKRKTMKDVFYFFGHKHVPQNVIHQRTLTIGSEPFFFFKKNVFHKDEFSSTLKYM